MPSDTPLKDQIDNFLKSYCSDETLDVEKIAFALNLSSRHLNRKLKEELNLSTSEYLKQYRLNKSLQLLRKGYAIEQVRKMSGFSTRAYFARCFKNQYGVTPKHYSKAKLDE